VAGTTDPVDAGLFQPDPAEAVTVDLVTLTIEGPGTAGSGGVPVTAPPRRGDTTRRLVRVGGEILATFGLIVLLFAVYELWGRSAIVEAHQTQLEQTLIRQWAAPPPATGHGRVVNPSPPSGSVLARLYIPAMHLHWVVVEGVDMPDLAGGPGHYPGTATPGQIGNFSVAGHRIPPIFWNLPVVRPGDPIVVETRTQWYLYQVTAVEAVVPDAVQVVAPTPDHIGVKPTAAMLTLTTCNPQWADYQRLVVHAKLVSARAHTAGPPVDLGI
jgi:sortase A